MKMTKPQHQTVSQTKKTNIPLDSESETYIYICESESFTHPEKRKQFFGRMTKTAMPD